MPTIGDTPIKQKGPAWFPERGLDFNFIVYFQSRPVTNRVCDAHEACADVEVQVVESFMFIVLNIRLLPHKVKYFLKYLSF